jgi:hypothetical protein
MRDPDDRLSRLDSYQALPLPLRRAVRMHLIHGIPVPEAMRLARRDRNVKRDWGQPAVQTVLTAYRADSRDYLAVLSAVQPQNDPNIATVESAAYDTPLPLIGPAGFQCDIAGCDRPAIGSTPDGHFCPPHMCDSLGIRMSFDPYQSAAPRQ